MLEFGIHLQDRSTVIGIVERGHGVLTPSLIRKEHWVCRGISLIVYTSFSLHCQHYYSDRMTWCDPRRSSGTGAPREQNGRRAVHGGRTFPDRPGMDGGGLLWLLITALCLRCQYI